MNEGTKIVVEQDDGCDLAGAARSAFAHGNTDIGALKGWNIVDAIAGHRNDFTCLFQSPHQ